MKIRIVKDASARGHNGLNLNNTLHCGENLLPDLTEVLMKFRQYKHCLSADIDKAFQNFKIAEPD